MTKRKSSRAAVRSTPQPKAHSFTPAVFIDDHGRVRALTIASAKAFSKKKLDAASRAVERKSDREMDRAIEAGDRETARAIRRLRKQERETDRSIARFFRRRIRTKVRPTWEIKHTPPKGKRSIWPSRSQALPKYDGPIRDKFNRRGVFFRSRYYSSRTAKPGVSKRVTAYIYRGSALDENGSPMFRTNVGLTIDEAACGLDHHEQVNRSAQKNAKVLNHAVLAMDHRWTPEQMLEVGERWAEERFGQYGLPYVISLHEPPPDCDERNWHLHVIWSWRPLERVGDHEWLVGESLRNELDGAQGMWLLRERFAALMTHMSFEAGDADVYTALSYAARGLPVEPQIHLDEGRTRRAREGEVVEANEENHHKVVRSKASLADDELRREDERLARLQEIEQRVANRFTKAFTMPAIPRVGVAVSKISTLLESAKTSALRLANVVSASVGPEPALQPLCESPRISQRVQHWIDSYQNKNFANLRKSFSATSARPPSEPVPAGQPESLTVTLQRTSAPRFTHSIAITIPPSKIAIATVPVPRTSTVLPLAAVPAVAAPPKAIATPVATSVRLRKSAVPALTNPLPVPAVASPIRFATASFSLPKTRSIAPLVRAFPAGPPLPSGQFAPPAKSPQLFQLSPLVTPPLAIQPTSSAPLPRLSNIVATGLSGPQFRGYVPLPLIDAATLTQLELTIIKASAATAAPEAEEDEAVTKRCPEAAGPSVSAESHARALLLDLLAEKRQIIARDKAGHWTVPVGLIERSGLTAEQIEGQTVQQDLARAAGKQRAELKSIAAFIAQDPQKSLVKTASGWRLTGDAPESLRMAVFGWREDRRAQDALGQLARMPAVDKTDVRATQVRQEWFLNFIYGRWDDGDLARQRGTAGRPAADQGRYPPGAGGPGGIGD